MQKTTTIRRPASWSKISAMLGEWSAYRHRGGPMTPARAARICAELWAVNHASRIGAPMPKDWRAAHPSLPYQLASWAEEIAADPIMASAGELPEIYISVGHRAA